MAFEDVQMYEVDSSNVDAFGYDEDAQVLYVRFRQGRLYWYSGVDAAVYDSFMMAPSKGKFVWQYLRGHYEYGEM